MCAWLFPQESISLTQWHCRMRRCLRHPWEHVLPPPWTIHSRWTWAPSQRFDLSPSFPYYFSHSLFLPVISLSPSVSVLSLLLFKSFSLDIHWILPIYAYCFNDLSVFFSVFQMGMSPSRMPQSQGMMGGHANNMVAQTANQGQFLPQGQFTVAAGGAMNVNVGMSQPITQTAVTQVRRKVLCWDKC